MTTLSLLRQTPHLSAASQDTLVKILVLTKTKAPELQVCYRVIDHHQDQRTTRLIQTLWASIQAGQFFPNPNFLCPTCQYRAQCARWA